MKDERLRKQREDILHEEYKKSIEVKKTRKRFRSNEFIPDEG